VIPWKPPSDVMTRLALNFNKTDDEKAEEKSSDYFKSKIINDANHQTSAFTDRYNEKQTLCTSISGLPQDVGRTTLWILSSKNSTWGGICIDSDQLFVCHLKNILRNYSKYFLKGQTFDTKKRPKVWEVVL